MRFWFPILLGLIGAAGITAILASNGGFVEPAPAEGIRQVAYLKTAENDVVVTAEFPPSEDEQTVRRHADGIDHTRGSRTMAYYFYAGLDVPSAAVEQAGSLDKANSTLKKAPGIEHWRYAFLKAPDGSGTFIDCQKRDASELCRQQAQNPPVMPKDLKN
jgi:hypothetical protein